MPFLAARAHTRPAAVILGAPYDATSSFRRGARDAPAAIRWASDSIETFSPSQRRDLEDVPLVDLGDLDLEGCAPDVMVERVRAAVAPAHGLPILLGGEHTVTIGAVSGLSERHADLAVLILDAHLDLRDEYEGKRWSHATVTRRLLEHVPADRVVILGARSGTRDEWAVAETLAAVQPAATLSTPAWKALAEYPIYLSVDMDAFDPSVAPGVGNPEPLGLRVEEFVTLLSVLRQGRVVGCDLVELNPSFDPSGRTAVLAAWLVREMILAVTSRSA